MPLFDIDWPHPVESYFTSRGIRLIAGVDEVGRGALAGPVVSAAVILNPDDPIEGINDSKKLTARRRNALATAIRQRALAWKLSLVAAGEIDRINILEATRTSMRGCLDGLRVRPELILLDAVQLDRLDIPSKSLIKGDEISLNIGAASIIAKVFRDRLMCRMAKENPEYHFERNKGYGTAEHLEAIRNFGPSPIHRRSFRPLTGLRDNGIFQ